MERTRFIYIDEKAIKTAFHTLGELSCALKPSYSFCILERRLERRSTSADISTISARGRYASSPSPATRWTDWSASPETYFITSTKVIIQQQVFVIWNREIKNKKDLKVRNAEKKKEKNSNLHPLTQEGEKSRNLAWRRIHEMKIL